VCFQSLFSNYKGGIEIKNHEKKIEKFYSTGSRKRKCDYINLRQHDEGFLSFGYWEADTKTYLDATKNLLHFFIKNSGIQNPIRMLNVACGYGTETFAHYDNFKPAEIIGLDITKVHMDYANNRAKCLKLDNKIKFAHGNACDLDFPESSFSHVVGIEGPVHFNTRLKFFKAASKVLNNGGELLLTDIILGRRINEENRFYRAAVRLIAKWWVVPKSNCVDESTYKQQLEEAGLKMILLKRIGEKVFPGYAKNGFTLRTLRIRLSQRGFFATIGLTWISWLLGWLYKRGCMEYIFIRAQKL
jgi:ubiquinone/menaquinone biosynthesis C-methylase UbiE